MQPRTKLDHLVWAVPDLERGMLEIERRFGIRPTLGGRHPGVGTRNALVDIGSSRYLEILAPDPQQHRFTGFGRWVDDLRAPRLVTWAARTADLDLWRDAAAAADLEPGTIQNMQRERPDGSLLAWRLLALSIDRGGRLPFCIEWQDRHPNDDLPPSGCHLCHLRIDAVGTSDLQADLGALGIQIGGDIKISSTPEGMAAIFDTPRGRIELN